MKSAKRSIQESSSKELIFELTRLQHLFNEGYELKVIWLPNHIKYSKGRELRGEIIGSTIYIYDKNYEKAKETLKHEFIEYLIEQAIEPYRKLLNTLISIIEEKSYEAKEKVVKALVKALI